MLYHGGYIYTTRMEIMVGATACVCSMEVIRISECLLTEVLLYQERKKEGACDFVVHSGDIEKKFALAYSCLLSCIVGTCTLTILPCSNYRNSRYFCSQIFTLEIFM